MQEGKAQAGLWADSPSFTMAAHELKAPLALIRQLAIELEAGEYTALERAVLAQRITLTAERALRLTTDLTKARRLENALFTLEAIDAAGLCNEVMSELQPLYHAHNKSLKTQVKSRQRLMVANRDLLRRIVANFADNALHYSADDSQFQRELGGRCAKGCASRCRYITVQAAAGWVCLSLMSLL